MWNLCSCVLGYGAIAVRRSVEVCASSGVASRLRAEGVYWSRGKWWASCAARPQAPAAAVAVAAAAVAAANVCCAVLP